ncbi:MAG: F0F1 ATP synthase subunit delta [Ottowia sp.]|nr:F0F1 ATP synthase subunit delta [Ottowia sp.]
MAEIATIARPYAEAIYRIARPNNFDVWFAFLSELNQLNAHPDFCALVSMPKVAPSTLIELVLAALKSPVTEEAKNFLHILVENRRFAAMPEILAQFVTLRDAENNARHAEISSVYPIEPAQLAEIVAALEKRFGRSLHTTVKINPDLIGGLRVQVGDEVLDASVRARLADMQHALTA